MKRIAASIITVGLGFSALAHAAKKEVVIYTARKEHLVKPLFEAYEKKTGVKITYITDKAGALMERIKGEGKRTKADLLFTVDAGNLWSAADQGILQGVASKTLESHIPAHLRDPENQWFGLSVRARTIAYSTKRVKPESLTNYEDLADPKWKGKLCLRTSKKVYNQSLVAMFIASHGEKKTEAIVKGWVSNLATKVFPNDTAVLEAIAAGQCDVGIVNSYYFARLESKDPKFPVKLFWPAKKDGGVHVNISGAGVTKHASNKAEAIKLMEWLSGAEAQKMFAELNFEFPVMANVPAADLVQKWGSYDPSLINVSKAGELQSKAVKLMDRAGYR
ncbi:extracellular solute-binding protein [Pseudobacteriovorax antillogorgiicola]|uniref:Iron(III) transport system substrate-binding protein n=1 Tax=Pseudobacteriovorax antillogorgiicola TaxID=1513793 RepID=A0A1Y6CG20_9BACT|nr:extracellular solute-binding protein [Pseudobacteriovorax antillogorgiicola]TCS47685.1 iron(III) transport system substrate-binding protein [Pseudobacteriovorax antillogorgiicola]SMF59539.1 iron(III) transport system substrate-binding protein [Pseudobacteriovorax antillogorgiicola]